MSLSFSPLMNLLGGSTAVTRETTTMEYIPLIPHNTTSYSSFGKLSPSILIIILVLAVAIIASIFHCFLLRHLNCRRLRVLHCLSSRRVSPENPIDTLLESLHLFAFSSVTRRRSDSSTAAVDCTMFMSKFEPDDQLCLLLLYCHAFYVLCVDTWLRSNQTCPLCRSPIFTSEAEILKTLCGGASAAAAAAENQCNNDSFRIKIGNVNCCWTTPHDGNSESGFSGDY